MTDDTALHALLIAATSLMNLGLALMVGALACVWFHRGYALTFAGYRERLAWALRIGALGALLGAGMALWAESALMADVPLRQAAGGLGAVLGGSHYGHAWMLGAASLVLILAAAGLGEVSPPRFCGAAIGIALFAGFRSSTSHAAAGGGWLPVAAEWVHALAVSLWAGAVILSAFAMPRCGESASAWQREALSRFVAGLSSGATVALAGVVFTGVFSAWRGLAGLQGDWAGSGYAAVLGVKLAFVAIAAALGGFNRLAVMPGLLGALGSPQGASTRALLDRFRGVLRIESCALFAVLIAAAVLATSAPAGAG